jgi:hypothetical protein
MSMELQTRHGCLDLEAVSAEMLEAAVSACLPTGDASSDKALELITPEEIAAVETETDDGDDAQEVETAEEISLKNGVYQEVRRKLAERFNIPPHEVAFIHDADTPAKKVALFKAVNQGRVRVLIGSTSKLGTGVNVQKRLVALHHVDEPWKPAELEQREGRILRQGNIYPEAFIFHYVTERSFDGYMLQTLESKARFISQIMAGEVTARTAEDVGDMVLTVAQVKAIASGNPMVQKRIELEVKLVKLDRLRAAYYNNRAAMRADLEELPERIAAQEGELRGHGEAIRARQPLEEDSFRITLKKNLGDVETVAFDKRERAGAHLRLLADLLMDRVRRGSSGMSLTEEVGSYRGFKVFVHVSGNSRFAHHSTLFNFQSEIHLRATDDGNAYIAQIGESNVGVTQSIDYQLRHLEDRLEQSRAGLEMLKTRLVTVRAEADKPWAHAAEYRRLRRRYEEMGAALQSAGLAVESNTTFTAEEGDEAAEEASATDSLTEAVSESSADELGARRNPFTGLEDFPIIATETDDDADEFDELAGGGSPNPTFGLFDCLPEGQPAAEGMEETDIFLTAQGGDLKPDEEEQMFDGADESADDMFGRAAEQHAVVKESDADSVCGDGRAQTGEPLSPKSTAQSKQSDAKKKKNASVISTGQSSFLWG